MWVGISWFSFALFYLLVRLIIVLWTYYPLIYFFRKMSLHILCPFWWCYFEVEFQEFFILHSNPLSNLWFANVFFLTYGLPFHCVDSSLSCKKSLVLIRFNVSIFSLTGCCAISKKPLSNPVSSTFLVCFLVFVVLTLTYMSFPFWVILCIWCLVRVHWFFCIWKLVF